MNDAYNWAIVGVMILIVLILMGVTITLVECGYVSDPRIQEPFLYIIHKSPQHDWYHSITITKAAHKIYGQQINALDNICTLYCDMGISHIGEW